VGQKQKAALWIRAARLGGVKRRFIFEQTFPNVYTPRRKSFSSSRASAG